MTRQPPSVSVILCTRNRSRRLGQCLDRVAASGRRVRADWELVFVDNGSTDDTQTVLSEWTAASSVDVKLVHEPRGGLSAARNRGIDASSGTVLAFVDDDCLVDARWLEAILAVHTADSPPDLVGGRVDLWDEADARMSIRPFDDALEIRDFRGICARLIGCNFSVRAQALRSIGLFDERLGAGTASGSAEDFDVFYRLLKAGYRLRFEPGVRAYHAHGRREPREIEALTRRYVRGRGAMYAKHAMKGDATMLAHFVGELLGRTRHRVRSELVGGAFEFLRVRGGAGLSTGRAR